MSVDHLKKAAGYRRKAQEIRAIVAKITITEAREQLLEAAAQLEECAQEEERKAHADGSQPEDLGSVDMTMKSTSAQCGRFSPRNRPNRRW